MARTALTPITLDPKNPTLNNAGTAVDPTNGMSIALASGAIPPGPGSDRLVLYVTNTTASTKTVTVKAGAGVAAPSGFGYGYPVPSQEQGYGDLTTGNLTATTGNAFIGPFEASRYIQQDGSIWVDFAAAMTGNIWAVLLPRNVSSSKVTGG